MKIKSSESKTKPRTLTKHQIKEGIKDLEYVRDVSLPLGLYSGVLTISMINESISELKERLKEVKND